MAITKIGTRVTVTVEAGKGESFSNAYTLDDVLAASDLGGWGMTLNYKVYFIPFSLWIDDDTYFRMYWIGRNMAVVFHGPHDDNYSYYSEATSHTLIGWNGDYNDQYGISWFNDDTVPSLNRRTWFGGDVRIANLHLYLSHYTYLMGTEDYQAIMKNSTLNDINFGLIANDYAELDNVQLNEGSYGFWPAGNPLMNNCVIINARTAILATSATQRAKGLKILHSELQDTQLRAAAGDKTLYLVDCEVDTAKLNFYNSGTTNSLSEQFLLTTTTVIVKDEATNVVVGADVTIYSATGSVLFSGQTDANGEISEEEVLYYYKWRLADVTGTLDEGLTDHEPFRMEISKDDFDPVILHKIYVEPGLPTTIRATLVEENPDADGLVNAYESEAMKHLFMNEAIVDIGDVSGLPPSTTPGDLYVALFIADPGEGGSIDNEVSYPAYSRFAVPRDSNNWKEFLGRINNINAILFNDNDGPQITITHYGIMKKATGANLIGRGPLGDGLVIANGQRPEFSPMAIECRID